MSCFRHRNPLPVLPPLAQYPLGHQRLGIFIGNGADVISAKYRALRRLSDSSAGNPSLLLPCVNFGAVCRQRLVCPALFSGL